MAARRRQSPATGEPSKPASPQAPEEVVAALAASRSPVLIGVRHHSPACAAVMEPLLEAAEPERIFLELPPELEVWLPWLGHADTVAPVALAAVEPSGEGLAFYPFADFSPELVAVRWAARNGVPVEAFDLPLAHRPGRDEAEADGRRGALVSALCEGAGADGAEELWDRLVETRAPGGTPESVRRASLLAGWALRADAAEHGVPRRDRLREQHMRARLEAFGAFAGKPRRSVAVVGAFHAPALLAEPIAWSSPGAPLDRPGRASTTSLIPYAFDLLDSRSGYPAGIRDPAWQQAVLAAQRAADPIGGVDAALSQAVVEVCRVVRRLGHVAGTPDAREAIRLARDLARLRGIVAPARRELVECLQTVLGRGEVLGFGRVLARAMDEVLVGRRRGSVPSGAPRCGLLAHAETLLAALGLPGPRESMNPPVELRLDPARSDLDRRRHVALERLTACGVPYARRDELRAVGWGEALGSAWTVQWLPSTEALLGLAGTRGVTLEQAATGALRERAAEAARADTLDAERRVDLLEASATCGVGALVTEWLTEVEAHVIPSAGVKTLVRCAQFLERLRHGHFVALPLPGGESGAEAQGSVLPYAPPDRPTSADLVAAAVRSLETLVGSDALDDVRALHELVESHRQRAMSGGSRLVDLVDRMASDGSPTMQGAALVAQVLLERLERPAAATRLSSWVDLAVDATARSALAARLAGLLVAGATLLESDAALLDGLVARVETLEDGAFLQRLAPLRQGFETLSPAARQRLLDALGERYPGAFGVAGARGGTLDLEVAPEWLARFAAADREGTAALRARGWAEPLTTEGRLAARGFERPPVLEARPEHALATGDRWRLILGREREHVGQRALPAFRALDELYGAGHGEGSRVEGGGGREAAFPTAREWAVELDALFGERVREEVLGRATALGHRGAALELDPQAVTPSIELLEQVLSLKGGLGEAALGRLRVLVTRVVDELVSALATRVRPALAGLTMPRSTRRRSDRVDLRRTIADNLRWVSGDEGAWRVTPRRMHFRSRGRRSIDWRIILAVDVSGSMEPSVIYSAMMAAILSRLLAVSVHFLAFSTEVIDLSAHVEDPLALLLEVQVGGGTHIAKALRVARQLVTVPDRTLVLTVSDFEEGFQVDGLLAEVRGLAEAGVTQLGVATLDDSGRPRYHRGIAELVVGAGMPVAALTPLELAQWVGEQLR